MSPCQYNARKHLEWGEVDYIQNTSHCYGMVSSIAILGLYPSITLTANENAAHGFNL